MGLYMIAVVVGNAVGSKYVTDLKLYNILEGDNKCENYISKRSMLLTWGSQQMR